MITRKLIVSLALAASLAAPVFALADTVEQLQTQIAALQAQLNTLQQQLQASQAPSSTLQNNDAVRATTVLKIRTAAGLSGTVIAKASAEDTGIIRCDLVSGGACPATANGLRWWYVDWNNSSLPNGWSAEATSEGSFLVKSAPATTQPPSLSISYISGNKNAYASGEKILLTMKGVELSDNTPGTPDEGYNVQVFISGANDGYSLQGKNAVYNSKTGYWDTQLTMPADTSKTYKLEAVFYCANGTLVCGQRYPTGEQVSLFFAFSVSGSGKSQVMVVTPNGGELYETGQSIQMPIRWTADCGYSQGFRLSLIKGNAVARVINDSISEGICSSGQRALPYYTTWPIPSATPSGRDYKIMVTGMSGDGGIGDDSDALFSIQSPGTPSITVLSPNGGEQWMGSPKITDTISGNEQYLQHIKWTNDSDDWNSTHDGTIKAYLERHVNGQYEIVGRIPPFVYGSIGWVVGVVSKSSCAALNGIDSNGCFNPTNQFVVPPGKYYVRVENTKTSQWDRSDDSFLIIAPETVPKIYNLNPSQGGTNTTVTIEGAGLAGTSGIEFYNSNNQIVGSLPPTAVSDIKVGFVISGLFAANVGPGTYQVGVVTNACPGGCNSNRLSFTLLSAIQQPTQISTGGQISQKLHYVQSSNSFYGIGSDNAVWKWDNSAKQWSRITDGSIKDDFHFINESDIYAIGMDNQIWRWNGIRWNQESAGGKIQQKIWYVDGNHIYGIGMDNQVWRYGSASGWTKITSNGSIKDDFHFISENDIYGIGMDGQIWRWHGAPTSAWRQVSSGGAIKQKLHFSSPTNIWGIGLDNRIWEWGGGSSWGALHDSGQVKDDFATDNANNIYGISLDGQIWKFPPQLGSAPSEKTFASLPQESSAVRANSEQQLANILVSIQAQLNEIAKKIRMIFEGFGQ